jgi:hypothetical protein
MVFDMLQLVGEIGKIEATSKHGRSLVTRSTEDGVRSLDDKLKHVGHQ